jgi:hypothetical protein
VRKVEDNIKDCFEGQRNVWSALELSAAGEGPITGSLKSDNGPVASINNAGSYWPH